MSVVTALMTADIDIDDISVKKWKKLSKEARTGLDKVIRDLDLDPQELRRLREAIRDDSVMFSAYMVAKERKPLQKRKK